MALRIQTINTMGRLWDSPLNNRSRICGLVPEAIKCRKYRPPSCLMDFHSMSTHFLGCRKTSITRGCIPVIIQDGIKVEYEDELPFHLFAVRLPSAWVHRLPELLEMMLRQPGWKAQARRAMKCVWPLFWWSAPWGRAFDMAMCMLRARMFGWARPLLDLHACTLQCAPEEEPWCIHNRSLRLQGRDQGGRRQHRGSKASWTGPG